MAREEFSSVADIVDKSALLVDKAIRGKDVPEVLLPYLYLSFASFFLYYGKDAVNTIYSVYKDSQVSVSEQEKSNVCSNFSCYFSETLDQLETSVSDKISIFKTDNTNLMFHDIVHEINHLINSKRSRVFLDQDNHKDIFFRIGVSVTNVDSNEKDHYYLNEVINSYESEEIEEMMVKLIYPHLEEIKNEKVKSLLKQYDPDIKECSYASIRNDADFMFEYKGFYNNLKTQVFNGDLEGVKNNFNSYFGDDYKSYSSLLTSLGESYYSNPDKVNKKGFMKFFGKRI